MKQEEAIMTLKNDFSWCKYGCRYEKIKTGGSCDICVENAKDMAIEAIEKQIPKKPHRIHANIFHCGNSKCDANFCHTWDKSELFKYCPFCGQAIDWGEE